MHSGPSLGFVASCLVVLSACDVLEIGPGPGGLTRALLESDAREVVAVEIDRAGCTRRLAHIEDAWRPGWR